MQIGGMEFKEVWLADFEFSAPPGEKPTPVCLVAWELATGTRLKLWQDDLQRIPKPPYSTDENSLFGAYYASAEMGCHLSLNWTMPANLLDLFTEFRNFTNGGSVPCGNSLLGALTYFGLNGIAATEKESMRRLVMGGPPWTFEERKELLNYCESDVASLERLLTKMSPILDMPRALLRGRYMKTVAQIEHNGVPIDTTALVQIRENLQMIQGKLIKWIDAEYRVYEGRTFKSDRFKMWLIKENIPWPLLASGKLDLKDDTFKEMSRAHPKVALLHELRVTLSQMRLTELAVGSDGRNRCLLSAFRSRTGRNQPSSNQFIFGPAVWLRGLIRPEPGYGLAYIDWSQQEFGIAAVLSGDPLMIKAYESGDPYLEFAKQANAVPSCATKESHRVERDQFKQCALAVQYGMGPVSLAGRVGQDVSRARDLLRLHRETYRRFWQWSDGVVDYGMLYGSLWTAFGWQIQIRTDPNPRFLRNFPMQANGAEMLRIACCLAIERGIRICAPDHDAVMIEAPLDCIDEYVLITQKAMSDASEAVLKGFRLRSDVKIVSYPDRYMDERGAQMWDTVWTILNHSDGVKR